VDSNSSRSYLIGADVQAAGGVIGVGNRGAVVVSSGDGTAGGINRAGQPAARTAEAELPAVVTGQLTMAVVSAQAVKRQAVGDQILIGIFQQQVAMGCFEVLRHSGLANTRLPTQPQSQLPKRAVAQTQTTSRNHYDHDFPLTKLTSAAAMARLLYVLSGR
jgi:hypothetical protein